MTTIPSSFTANDVLPNGRSVHIRSIRPSDKVILQEEFHKLSPASVRDRFFNVKLSLTAKELIYFTEVDFIRHVALVAALDEGHYHRPAGVGRFICNDDLPGHSEIAITIADELQGQGIGKLLLNQLIHCASELGVHYLDASIFAQNTRMSNLLHHTGLPIESRTESGIRTLSIAL
jgi:GNAT superfamily N-acetyltransferase